MDRDTFRFPYKCVWTEIISDFHTNTRDFGQKLSAIKETLPRPWVAWVARFSMSAPPFTQLESVFRH